jgi:acyl carrier protein|tara:strand:+ start:5229 stop:5477 length:249 start_codon:yes stop_codon:yes gene_type:complete
MSRDEISKIVNDIFTGIFKLENEVISNETNTDDVKNWDSLNHIILINAIENEFKIKFPLGEMADLRSIGDIIDSCIIKLEGE